MIPNPNPKSHPGRAGRKPRQAPKSAPIWCGQITQEQRAFIVSCLTAEERYQALEQAAKAAENNKMSVLGKFINKTNMKKVNSALKKAGYSPYEGDHTTAFPHGCVSGYVCNLIESIAGSDYSEQRVVERIIINTLCWYGHSEG